MSERPIQTERPQRANTLVLLLAAELFPTPPDRAALQATLTEPHRRIRLLVRLAGPSGLRLAEAIARTGVEVEVLVPADMIVPPTELLLARMPPGSSETDTQELALALSDSLLIGADTPDMPLVRLARELGKPLIQLGEKPPRLRYTRRSIAHGLDPEQPGWHRLLRRIWGRCEQSLLELAAFNWRGRKSDGIARSREKLRACLLTREWHYTPYFAPENWKDLAPDRAALDTASPVVASFNRLDRSALHGAYIHRDLAWATHLAAAFAVLFAVAGAISLFPFLPEAFWPATEFAALAYILGATTTIRMVRLQDRWTACRLGAEQLRIARLCLPLLVVPSALCSLDNPPGPDESLLALAEVKRAVRDQGLPHLSPTLSPRDAARWLALIVTDQFGYHRDNHHKLHCAEQRLNHLTTGLFALAFLAVCWHLWIGENQLLLLLTAAVPAFAAAFHGISTRLGLVHRIELSRDAASELKLIQQELNRLIATQSAPEAAWVALRKLAFRAAEAMGRETRSWHSQVRRQKDELT